MTSNIKTSKEIKKKSTYEPNVKARLNSHLLLKEEDKVKLSDILSKNASGIVEIAWDLSKKDYVANQNQFFPENGLDINADNVQYKWTTRYSTKMQIIKQCICGSYKEKAGLSTSQVLAT
ncbi:hypothetical protein F8M41_022615 [Gigaspora margarita]|uniref:Uncharacterized protein n=1 Tax=Gigaspora margarita TaxID=4874 RepID=A0A8H4AES9_GIGMA|nr:hypothetical protein F8M41_022615 [Gigaspora margarita]